MEIDNKTKAAVLREFADNMSEPVVDRSVYELARSEADKLDPPLQPISFSDLLRERDELRAKLERIKRMAQAEKEVAIVCRMPKAVLCKIIKECE